MYEQSLRDLWSLDLSEQRKEALKVFIKTFGKIAKIKDIALATSFIENSFNIKSILHPDQAQISNRSLKDCLYVRDGISPPGIQKYLNLRKKQSFVWMSLQKRVVQGGSYF